MKKRTNSTACEADEELSPEFKRELEEGSLMRMILCGTSFTRIFQATATGVCGLTFQTTFMGCPSIRPRYLRERLLQKRSLKPTQREEGTAFILPR